MSQDENWEFIRNNAKSEDFFDRLAALARSVLFFELALIAIGTPHRKREGIARIFNKSDFKKTLDIESINNILDIIELRNKAVHEGKVPSPKNCFKAVEKLFLIFTRMKSQFVTRKTAAELSMKILCADTFHKAFLFGSLTTDKEDPGDIDILLFDNGKLSSISSGYGDYRNYICRRIFETAKIDEDRYLAALDLDWIDVVVVDHEYFVNDSEYIRNIASHQNPNFLLNISSEIMELDKKTGQWFTSRRLPFKKWGGIREKLVKEGLIFE